MRVLWVETPCSHERSEENGLIGSNCHKRSCNTLQTGWAEKHIRTLMGYNSRRSHWGCSIQLRTGTCYHVIMCFCVYMCACMCPHLHLCVRLEVMSVVSACCLTMLCSTIAVWEAVAHSVENSDLSVCLDHGERVHIFHIIYLYVLVSVRCNILLQYIIGRFWSADSEDARPQS